MHRFRLLVLSAIAVTTACTSQPRGASQLPMLAGVYPFYARALDREGVVIESFRGDAYVSAAEVRVVVRSGQLRTAPTDARRPIALVATLAYGDTGSGWNHRRRSRRVLLSELPTRDGVLVDSVLFVIPDTRGLDLRTHWVSFELQSQIRVPGEATWREATRPVHADRNMFVRDSSASGR